MKQFLKVVVWIIILGGVGFGVYMIMPEYPHDFVKSFVQPVIDSSAKTRIDQVKNLPIGVKGLDGVTYKMALTKNTGMNCWVYEKDETTGVETVTFRGNGASINMKDYTDYNGKLYTSCAVKFDFVITGNNVEIIPYLDGTKMRSDADIGTEKDKEVLHNIVSQMYGGVQEEEAIGCCS